MYRIDQLILYDMNGNHFNYNFEYGLNYFQGGNNTGKTEYYNFIDYMFGSSVDVYLKPWFKESLQKATIHLVVDGITYVLTRTRHMDTNYLNYLDDDEHQVISQREYKDKLNSIFSKNDDSLREIRNFTEEELTYRTFTLFNFLGETRQGVIHDFFDKCSDIKYSTKITPLLNYIFNENLEKIKKLQEELEKLLINVKELERKLNKFEFICTEVNKNLKKLGSDIWYTGYNADDIRRHILDLKKMQEIDKKKKVKNISELEVMYNNISEQIKIYENKISDVKQFEKSRVNRKLLLEKLDSLINIDDKFNYLVEPVKNLTIELEKGISFNKYIISDNTINELKKQRKAIKLEIERNDSRFTCFSLDDKSKAIAIIEEYLKEDTQPNEMELKTLNNKIKEIRNYLKILQNLDDVEKINELSHLVTSFYKSAEDISTIVDVDIKREGFRIQYLKKGNILQPLIKKVEFTKDSEEIVVDDEESYFIGSMARHTLIQLCGYLGFLCLLIKENKYPLIPTLIIDHISKPFDDNNMKAIGAVIESAYRVIGKEKLQIIIFDSKDHESMGLEPDFSVNLVQDTKTGFNPFYIASSATEEE